MIWIKNLIDRINEWWHTLIVPDFDEYDIYEGED